MPAAFDRRSSNLSGEVAAVGLVLAVAAVLLAALVYTAITLAEDLSRIQ